MSDSFKAIVINQIGEKFTREVKSIEKSFLKHGDVLVKVDYSSLNYKDALIMRNGARLVKDFPHIPGIDFSGSVVESGNNNFKPGDEVILTGWRVGEIYYGGYSQYAKVNGDFLITKPKSLTSKQIMILGTAGFTALSCSFAINQTHSLECLMQSNLSPSICQASVGNPTMLAHVFRISQSSKASVAKASGGLRLLKLRGPS